MGERAVKIGPCRKEFNKLECKKIMEMAESDICKDRTCWLNCGHFRDKKVREGIQVPDKASRTPWHEKKRSSFVGASRVE